MKNTIDFKEKKHEYIHRDSGLIVPCVTNIIRVINPDEFIFVDEKSLYKSKRLGSVVHKTTELFDNNRLGSYPPMVNPYIDAWRIFISDCNVKNILIENIK